MDELSDGTLLYAASDNQNGTQRSYLLTSGDGGQTWSSKVSMADSLADPRNPQLAVDASDRIWASVKKSALESVVVTSDDAGVSWSDPIALTSPTGTLSSAVVRSRDGRTVIAGITTTGQIYVHHPEADDE